jgi:hypothetical protein
MQIIKMMDTPHSQKLFKWLGWGLLFFAISLAFSGQYLRSHSENLLLVISAIYLIGVVYWSVLGFTLKGIARKIVVVAWCLCLLPLVAPSFLAWLIKTIYSL